MDTKFKQGIIYDPSDSSISVSCERCPVVETTGKVCQVRFEVNALGIDMAVMRHDGDPMKLVEACEELQRVHSKEAEHDVS